MHWCNISTARKRAKAWIILGLLVVAYLFVPFHRFSPSVLAVDIMRELQVDAGFFGLLSSSFFLTYGLMQLPSGILADSLGPRKILPAFFGLSGIGTLIMGMAEMSVTLLLGRALIGFGIAVVFVSSVKVIANWFPPDQSARINGLFLGLGGIGMILASGPLARVCTALGWRTTFLAGGILALAVAVMMRVWVHDAPPGSRESAPAESAGTTLRKMVPGILSILKDINYWMLCVWFFCAFSLHNSFGGLWGGPYLMHVHHLDVVETGSVLNIMGLGVLSGGLITGWIAESVLRSYKKVMLASSVVLPILFVLLATCGEHLPLWALYIWFFSLAFFGMGSAALGIGMARRLYSASRAATAAGLLNTLPSLGVFFFQSLTGFILDHFRAPGTAFFSADAYAMACVPFILFGMAGIVCTILLREPAQQNEKTATTHHSKENCRGKN